MKRSPTDDETLVPDPAMARDAAMAYLDANYRGLVPVPMPDWYEEDRTPAGLVGASSFQYRGKEWIVAVSFPSDAPASAVNPAATVYQVTIDNEANGFVWEGEVDATGEVTERMASGYTEPPETDDDEWKVYFGKKFGYMFRYPRNCAVVSKNLDEALQVSTATTTGEGWPCLTVTHYDSDFYHPPAGTDLKQWILDWERHHDEMETEIEIAGSPAVHLITRAAPGAYAYDEYYFVKGEQLFCILIVHCGNGDWELYDAFSRVSSFPAHRRGSHKAPGRTAGRLVFWRYRRIQPIIESWTLRFVLRTNQEATMAKGDHRLSQRDVEFRQELDRKGAPGNGRRALFPPLLSTTISGHCRRTCGTGQSWSSVNGCTSSAASTRLRQRSPAPATW